VLEKGGSAITMDITTKNIGPLRLVELYISKRLPRFFLTKAEGGPSADDVVISTDETQPAHRMAVEERLPDSSNMAKGIKNHPREEDR
jgi:hypothetical protein